MGFRFVLSCLSCREWTFAGPSCQQTCIHANNHTDWRGMSSGCQKNQTSSLLPGFRSWSRCYGSPGMKSSSFPHGWDFPCCSLFHEGCRLLCPSVSTSHKANFVAIAAIVVWINEWMILCVLRSHRSFRFGARSEGLRQKQGFDRKYLSTGREDFQPNRQAWPWWSGTARYTFAPQNGMGNWCGRGRMVEDNEVKAEN